MKSNDKVQPTEKPFNRSLGGLEELRPSKLPVSGSNQTQGGGSSESSNQQAKE